MTKIYTKTGDKGETSLFDGRRVGKCCLEMQVVGEIDELNAALGVVVAMIDEGDEIKEIRKLRNFINNIQRDLFKIGSEVASLQVFLSPPARGGARGGGRGAKEVSKEKITEIEEVIDRYSVDLPELKNFILPGGSLLSAHLHQARVICRRAERRLVEFGKTTTIRSELYQYFNRLSDFLFTAARWVNYKEGVEEIRV